MSVVILLQSTKTTTTTLFRSCWINGLEAIPVSMNSSMSSRHIVGGKSEGGERARPVLLPDVVGQFADHLAKVTEDETELGDFLLQRRAWEPTILHSFVHR